MKHVWNCILDAESANEIGRMIIQFFICWKFLASNLLLNRLYTILSLVNRSYRSILNRTVNKLELSCLNLNVFIQFILNDNHIVIINIDLCISTEHWHLTLILNACLIFVRVNLIIWQIDILFIFLNHLLIFIIFLNLLIWCIK